MSLILDALNKAEREQDFDPNKVPDLQTVHAVGGAPNDSSAKPPWLWMAAAAAVALAFTVLLILYLRLLGGSPEVASEQVAEKTAPLRATSEDATSVKTVTGESKVKRDSHIEHTEIDQRDAVDNAISERPTPLKTPSEVAELYATQVDVMQEVPDPLPLATVNTGAEVVETARAQAIWDELERERELLKIEPEPQPLVQAGLPSSKADIPDEVEPEGLGADQRLAHYEDVPFLHKLPVLFQNEIPTLMYNLHDFEQGSVMINKKRYQAGATMPNGVVVEQVLYDGVLLNYSGRRFKLSALNSWVNF